MAGQPASADCKGSEERRRDNDAPRIWKDGDHYVVVASKGGAPHHPQWLHNLEANPIVEIELAKDGGTETFKAKAKPIMSGPERDRLYEHLSEVWPGFRDYQQRTERTIPVVVLERVPG